MSNRLNLWTNKKCAKAFWSQQHLPPYRRLLADTLEWANPAPGERWLDLGCGGGALSRAIWESSGGRVLQIIGVDCAAVNEKQFQRLRAELRVEQPERLSFVCHNFSSGLTPFATGAFDRVISGLSISYAESRDDSSGVWTTAAYDRLLREVQRVLRPGGRFVFSVNVPEPSWTKVGFVSLPYMMRDSRPLQHLKNSWRMLCYGSWLKQEARRGRFHYLSSDVVTAKLRAAGFTEVEHRFSYAGQAYIFRANKPV